MANEHNFSGKAQFYNSRPTYPQECIDYLVNKFGLSSNNVIADVGAGTGILTKPFLNMGCSAYAVEPNDDMFTELSKNLSQYSNVILLKTSAEKTEIPENSCDAVVVGTAFHWFDKNKFRSECERILKNKKHIAILRISNNTDADKEIDKMRHYTEQDIQSAKEFFRDGFFEHIKFEYYEAFDEDRYINNLLSSAAAPLPSDARFDDYVEKCRTVYSKHFENGIAHLPFVVNCFVGSLDT